jgi:hypothetical protein
MTDIKEQFLGLEGCDQTEIVMADGEKVILFHNKPLSDQDISIISKYTSKGFYKALEGLGFNSHKVGNA